MELQSSNNPIVLGIYPKKNSTVRAGLKIRPERTYPTGRKEKSRKYPILMQPPSPKYLFMNFLKKTDFLKNKNKILLQMG